jgi:hypothetical protein
MLYSVFESEFKTKIDDKSQWVKDLQFYMGDLSKDLIHYETDWRFKEVLGKRKQVKFLGTVDVEFPVVFPLVLNNGVILEDIYYHRKNFKDSEDENYQ